MADIVRARGGLSVFVARDGARASAFVDALALLRARASRSCASRPGTACPTTASARRPAVAAERMATLARPGRRACDGKTPPLLVTTVAGAAAARAAARGACSAASYAAQAGHEVDIADLERYFAVNGYRARLHRLGARRVRHPRRGDRRLPAGRRGAGAPRPVRRHPGIDPRLRSRDPALDQAAARRSTCCRSARRCWTRTPSPASARAIWPRSARRATTRSTPPSARAAAAPGMEHWLPLFYERHGDPVRLPAARTR